MNNIWGKTSLNGTSTVVDPTTGDIYADKDLYITTTENHRIYVNYGKQNTADLGKGDLIFNEKCTNANVIVQTGNLLVPNGDISCVNLDVENDFLMGGDMTSQCLLTSQDGFNPSAITTVSTAITPLTFAVESFVANGFNGTSIGVEIPVSQVQSDIVAPTSKNPYNTPIDAGSTYVGASLSRLGMNCSIPAGINAEVIVNMNVSTTVVIDWINGGGTMQYSVGNFPISNTNGNNMVPNQWYTVTNNDAIVYQAGVLYDIPIYVQFVPIKYGNNYTNVNKYSNGYSTTTTNYTLGVFRYRFLVPCLATDTIYALCPSLKTTWTGNFASGTYYNVAATASWTQTSYMNYNQTVGTFTYQQLNLVAPPNPTLGMTLVNAFQCKQRLPRYSTGWFEVVTYGTYVIAHNLSMNILYPVQYSIVWCQTANVYPFCEVTFDYANSYAMSYDSANQMTFHSLARVAYIQAGTAKTTGYWNINLY